MLDVNTEFRRGIFFIRLNGILDKNTVDKFHKEVTNIVKQAGIINVVFNLENLKSIDIKGINALLYNYEITNQNCGKALICNLNNDVVKHRINNSRLLKYMYETSNELTAINVIDL